MRSQSAKPGSPASARAERLVFVGFVQQPRRGGAVAQRDAVVRVDRQRGVEHARGVAVAAVTEHVGGARDDGVDRALVAFDQAVEEALGLAAVEHAVGAAQAIHRQQRLFVVHVGLEHQLQVLLAAREAGGFAVGRELDLAERDAGGPLRLVEFEAVDQRPARRLEVGAAAEAELRTAAERQVACVLRCLGVDVLLPQRPRALALASGPRELAEFVARLEVRLVLGDQRLQHLHRLVVGAEPPQHLGPHQHDFAPLPHLGFGGGDAVAHFFVLATAARQRPQAELRLHAEFVVGRRLRLLGERVEQFLELAGRRGELAALQLLLRFLQQAGQVVRIGRILGDGDGGQHEPRQGGRRTAEEHHERTNILRIAGWCWLLSPRCRPRGRRSRRPREWRPLAV